MVAMTSTISQVFPGADGRHTSGACHGNPSVSGVFFCGDTMATEETRAYYRAYYQKNRAKISAYQRAYREAHKESLADYRREYFETNRERIIASQKAYRATDRGKRLASASGYRHRMLPASRAKKAARQRLYMADPANRASSNAYQRRYRAERMRTDPAYRLANCVRSAISKGLMASGGSKRGGSTFARLPYTPEELKRHLESLFEPWMNWGNHGCRLGMWAIDHIIPQSSFRYTSLDDPRFADCWALSNLRPMGVVENIQKSNKTGDF
jgi:hypothetical protein